MKNIRLIDINVNGVVGFQRLVIDIILNGCYVMINEKLLAVYITRESADTVVDRLMSVKAADQIVKRIQRRYLPAR